MRAIGVEIDVSAALARSIDDINYPSWQNLEDHLLACKFWLQRYYGNNVEI